ncbi:hypothetical protein SCHPADRAFT_927211 [Schizopora paradoxa]|uniref:Arginine N-methyltransferase 2 n=1 Tax=Schizopora paradoxa TaxID=27342 RepID=A0A0H2RV14_9AGAM|nr:hypothetical protein SCHPADRAFT_927211 [Schizopora paradoxa]
MEVESVSASEEGESLIEAILEKRSSEEIHSKIKNGAPLWYQNQEGISALHAAAYNEDLPIIKVLLENGAVWNSVDDLGNTAGDIALSFNNEDCYRTIRDAGLRSEFFLSHLSSKSIEIDAPSSIILRNEDSTAAGSQSEFLNSPLLFTKDENGQAICKVKVEDEEIGVMMGWEREIMKQTVHQLVEEHPGVSSLKVLNIGFGLGIIDGFFQSLSPPPAEHFIIEAHPDVLKHMKEQGWYENPGVTILEGRWQDVIDDERLLGLGGLDIVYTDTFSESYQDLKEFFEHLPDLLSGPNARFSFFNGLGATNALFYDVYTNLADLHLTNLGMVVKWSDVDVGCDDGKWSGTRKYFGMRLYRLPIAQMAIQ